MFSTDVERPCDTKTKCGETSVVPDSGKPVPQSRSRPHFSRSQNSIDEIAHVLLTCVFLKQLHIPFSQRNRLQLRKCCFLTSSNIQIKKTRESYYVQLDRKVLRSRYEYYKSYFYFEIVTGNYCESRYYETALLSKLRRFYKNIYK